MTTNEPPAPNPMLSAYEAWAAKTPLVTRYILSAMCYSYLVSWFVNPHYALATIPQFVIFHFELYRLILSPLVNTNIISVVFAFLSFSDVGRRLEQSIGSTSFGWLCASIGLLTNIGFLVITVVLSAVSDGNNSQTLMFASSSGLWTILFGVMSLECVKAPRNTTRPLLFARVPALYYPLALYFFFALLSGSFSFSYLISIGVGYAYGFGYLDKLKLTPTRVKHWEDTVLANFYRREGWIAGNAATGSDAWADSSPSRGGSPVLPMFGAGANANAESPSAGNTSSTPGASRPGSVFRTGTAGASENSASSATPDQASFPTSSGRKLGSNTTTSRRTAAETRAARLEALERQAERDNKVDK